MISVIFIGIASVINSQVLECLGKTDIDLYGEERGGKYRSIDKRVAREGKLYNAQEEFITPDGIHHNTIVSKNIINNDIYSWLLVVRRDITDFIHIQNELETTNRLNHLILNNSNAGYIFIGPDHIVKWKNVSHNLCPSIQLTYQKGRICYENVRGLNTLCPDCIMEKAIQSGKTERMETVFGEGTNVEIIATPVWDEKQNLKGTVLRIEDITQKKIIEKELRQVKENAEKSDRLICFSS